MLLPSLKGYRLSSLPHDVAAGAVVAALSLPIAMGYAQIAGLPAGFGLLASIVAPLAFALFTRTRSLVFGMDSATSAITGSVLAGLGYALGSAALVGIMPLFTLLTGAFLLLFSLLRLGALVQRVPIPVMNGFVVGVSLSVIISQIPTLTGIEVSAQSDFVSECIQIVAGLSQTNLPSLAIGIVSLVALLVMGRKCPKVPGALIVLAVMTVLSLFFDFRALGVETLGTVSLAPPVIAIPSIEPYQLLKVASCAFVVALVCALESLLCLQTFSLLQGERAHDDRELVSFGLSNMISGLFGCAPNSASLSRTAAAVNGGGVSQITGIASAAFVALASLACAPLLSVLPRSCLSAIVIVALLDVIDTRAIRRYARHLKPAMLAFSVTAIVVLFWGALPGVAAGVVISLAALLYRRHHDTHPALFGVLPQGRRSEPKTADRPDPGVDYVIFKMSGNLTFLNINKLIDKLLSALTPNTRAVIVKISKVDSIDATATVKLFQLVEMLHRKKIHVKFVRKMRPTNDRFTRYELGSLMQDAKTYPNVRSALAGLKRDVRRENANVKTPGTLGDHPVIPAKTLKHRDFELIEGDEPVMSVRDRSENDHLIVLSGKVTFPVSKEEVPFLVEAERTSGTHTAVLKSATFLRAATGTVLAEYEEGTWYWAIPKEKLAPVLDELKSYLSHV